MPHEQFFDELFSRLEESRRIDRELDRVTSYRFNVFDYLDQKELGLSRIIADLLNPTARHGQGILFLSILLALDGIRNALNWPALDPRGVTVVTERQITDKRRIDISVEIVDPDGNAYCLSIENKPYGPDKPKQVMDYLQYLKCRYDDRFILIYVSPTGEGPSEQSISKKSLEGWKKHFAIMPYVTDPLLREDEFEEMRLRHTLTHWLGECRKNCEVDRLRWFLGDAERFCRETIGGLAMASERENDTIRRFVLSDSKHLDTALSVHRAWPLIRDDVCKRFLEHLCKHIDVTVRKNRYLEKTVADIVVDCRYGGASPWQSYIWLYRKSWREYRGGPSAMTRSAICLNNAKSGSSGWGAGVISPISREYMWDDDGERRDRLDKAIETSFERGHRTDRWPRWIPLDACQGDWNSLVVELEKECGRGYYGRITDYFVTEFVAISKRAIPIIDGLEGTGAQGTA